MKCPRIKIEVTQDIIDNAVRANSGHCIIADALKVAIEKLGKDARRISVDLQTIRWSDDTKHERYVYLTPLKAQRCICQFDQGIKPTPFSIRISGGQTLSILPRKKKDPSEKKPIPPALKERNDKRKSAAKKLKMSELQQKGTEMAGPTEIHIEGGRLPPKSVLTGHRRQFGVRGMGDLNAPTDQI